MCHGCYYYGEFEREEFLKKVTQEIDHLHTKKFQYSIRQFRSESIAYLCIWRARKELRAAKKDIRKAISKRVHKRFRQKIKILKTHVQVKLHLIVQNIFHKILLGTDVHVGRWLQG